MRKTIVFERKRWSKRHWKYGIHWFPNSSANWSEYKSVYIFKSSTINKWIYTLIIIFFLSDNPTIIHDQIAPFEYAPLLFDTRLKCSQMQMRQVHVCTCQDERVSKDFDISISKLLQWYPWDLAIRDIEMDLPLQHSIRSKNVTTLRYNSEWLTCVVPVFERVQRY